MEHVAILRKGPLDKILSGQKTVESRWYKSSNTPPYKQISKGQTIWLKYSGGPVVAKARVSKAQFYELSPKTVQKIYNEHGKDLGFTSLKDLKEYSNGKTYCTLVWLNNVERVTPFFIDKKGFGNMDAWLIVPSIKRITIRTL